MENNFKAFLFDLGNVLVSFDHRIAVKRIANFSRKSPEEIYQLFFDSEFTCLYEEGNITSMEFFLKIKSLLGLDINYENFIPIWNEIFFLTNDNLQVHRLTLELKDKYKIFLISNINELHFNYIKQSFKVLDGFEKLFLSYEVRSRKPDPEIYKIAIEHSCALPQQIVYIDDREDLVKTGQGMGLNCFLFKGARELRKELELLGVMQPKKYPG